AAAGPAAAGAGLTTPCWAWRARSRLLVGRVPPVTAPEATDTFAAAAGPGGTTFGAGAIVIGAGAGAATSAGGPAAGLSARLANAGPAAGPGAGAGTVDAGPAARAAKGGGNTRGVGVAAAT